MTAQFTRAGYTFTPTTDQATGEPGPLWVAKDGESHTVQPDFLDGLGDDKAVRAFLDTLFAHLRGERETLR